MTRYQAKRLALRLESFYREISFFHRIKDDPIEIPRRYKDPRDIEVVAWLTAALSYGRVDLFKNTVGQILDLSSGHPDHYLRAFDLSRERKRFRGIYYRLNATEDLLAFVYLMSRVLVRHGSLKNLFVSLYRKEEEDIGPTLSRVIAEIRSFDLRPIYGRNQAPAGLRQLLSAPSSGSACKRMNLFLRWMVRPKEAKDGIDFGLWPEIPAEKLIIPLDTHIARISRYLGLTTRKSSGWKMAKEITDSLLRFDPHDPVKYDFALCHLGISGACPIKPNWEKCGVCPLLGACKRGRINYRQRPRKPLGAQGDQTRWPYEPGLL
ncbi:MAG: TIGR02757 family protein [Nitrospira sp.]|nr:TIGR02757 family protein [Candidatus Manganitrophaceae bacterium]HIL34807.1 TIGR02757 family protein [Candidatus Manganitrophaceae bacterium]